MKFLAIHEAPCVGTVAETFEADTVQEAEDITWDRSCSVEEFVMGGYDLYKIVWDRNILGHRLIPILCGEEVEYNA